MDTDLFMKRWILLMKYCEVKTKKQIYLVFLRSHLLVGILPASSAPALLFVLYFLIAHTLIKHPHVFIGFYSDFMTLWKYVLPSNALTVSFSLAPGPGKRASRTGE